MKNNPITTFVLAMIMIFPVLACGVSEAASKNPFLESVLNASDDREFNKALSIYGPLQAEDVKTVVKATDSYSTKRRKYGAMMLSLCRVDGCGDQQREVVRKTKDAVVWAVLVETAAKDDEKFLSEKPELLEKALASDNSELLAPALRVGLKIGHEGIQEKVRKLLDSTDPKILEVVLNNLSADVAKQESPHLARMLADEKTYGDVDMQIALALIKGEDAQFYPDIKAFIERLKSERSDHLFFNYATFSEDKQVVDLLWKMTRLKDDSILGEFREQAYDALTRRVWAPSLREPATVELMQQTLGYLKKASLDTNPRAHMDDEQYTAKSALYLIAFLNKGNTEFDSFIYGKDAIAFTEKWLKEHGA